MRPRATSPSSDPLAKGDHGLFASTARRRPQGQAPTRRRTTRATSRTALVTIDELVKYLEKEIPNEAREIGKTDKEKELSRSSSAAGRATSG